MALNLIGKIRKKLYPLGFYEDFKILLKTSIPLVLTNYGTFMISLVSMLFCGHIGKNELDAVSLSITLINILGMANVMGISSACETLFPQIYGSKNKHNLGIVVQKGLIISVIASFPAIGLLLNSKNFTILLDQEIEIANMVDEYMLIYIPSIFFYGANSVLSKYVQCQHIIYPVLAINFITNVINASLHAVFIYVLKFGLRGAAVSVTICNFLNLVLLVIYIYFSKIYLDTFKEWSWKCLENWRSYLKFAIPGVFMLLMEWLSYEIGTFLSGLLGKVDLAGQAIVQQVLAFCFMTPYGMSVAGSIYIGRLLGSSKPNEARNACLVFLTLSGTCIFTVMSLLLATSTILPSVFTNDLEIKALVSQLLIYIAFIHVGDAGQGVLSGVLKAVGAQKYGVLMNGIGFYIVGMPIALSLMFKTKLRVFGFWIGIGIGITVLVIMQMVYISRIDWFKESEAAIVRANIKKIRHRTDSTIEELAEMDNHVPQPIKSFKCLIFKRVITFIGVFLISSIGYFTRDLAKPKQLITHENSTSIVLLSNNYTLTN